MSEIPVHIYFVLDRSGSMKRIKSDVIGGFNAFLDEQRAQPGRCRFSMIQFDTGDPHEILYEGADLADVRPLDPNTFQPRSMTPLLDAEGWMIGQARQHEARRKQRGEEDEAVLFVTFTDGEENSSVEWSYEALVSAKKEAEEDGWAFMYLGCGPEAYEQHERIGTSALSSLEFSSDEVSTSLDRMSGSVSRYRTRASRGKRTSSRELFEEND